MPAPNITLRVFIEGQETCDHTYKQFNPELPLPQIGDRIGIYSEALERLGFYSGFVVERVMNYHSTDTETRTESTNEMLLDVIVRPALNLAD